MLLTEEMRHRRRQAIQSVAGDPSGLQARIHGDPAVADHPAAPGSIKPAATASERPSTLRDVGLYLLWVAGLVVLGGAAAIVIHPAAGIAVIALATPRLLKHLSEVLKGTPHG
jgi:hypothetical protein